MEEYARRAVRRLYGDEHQHFCFVLFFFLNFFFVFWGKSYKQNFNLCIFSDNYFCDTEG